MVCSSSLGTLYLIKIVTNETGGTCLSEDKVWKQLHAFKNGESSSCTSLSTYDDCIVTIGDNGSINFLTMNAGILRTIGNK